MEELLKYCHENKLKFNMHHDYGYPYFEVIKKGISHSHKNPLVVLKGIRIWI